MPYDDGTRILRGDAKVTRDLARADIDDGNAILGGEGDVSFFVAGERDANRFIETGGLSAQVEVLYGIYYA